MKSSAVNSDPSWKLTPSRSVSVTELPSIDQSVASDSVSDASPGWNAIRPSYA